ncbi:MAG: hypothetical protein IJ449_02920 [Clostridia bacterium]|nr:hypothetical protein [Clostridia bacterium]
MKNIPKLILTASLAVMLCTPTANALIHQNPVVFVNEKFSASSDYETQGILCSVLGHELETKTSVVYEHKVRETSPRCDKKTYAISQCTRCTYLSQELISSVPAICCIVD